jgi:uncharacterized membrane protein YdjX (TVP38/TMEM64 family)
MNVSESFQQDRQRRGAKFPWRPIVLLGGVVAIMVGAWLLGVGEKILALRSWIEGLGPWGPVVFVLIYVGATVAALPGSVLTIAAGALFGSVEGVICVSIASTLGASLSFLIGRYFARDSVARWLAGNEKFQRLDRLTEQQGAIMVALTRVVPLFPFNLLNYGFGLTRVRFWTYVFWSWLCMLPMTVVYVVFIDAITTSIAERRVPWPLVGVIVVSGAILALLVRSAGRKLRSVGAGESGQANRDEAAANHG